MNKLKRGIFWVTDIETADMIIVSAECDTDGRFTEDIDPRYLSRSGKDLNHKNVWEALGHRMSYNYYPRGRVEVSRGRAIIYCSVHICLDRITDKIISGFGLLAENGITNIRIHADGSEHYGCFLDK